MSTTSLKELLLDTLRRNGPMTFERYMALCLYHPDFGYYTQGRERTGVAGDYFTSPDLHPVFARLVARQAVEMWNAMGCPRPFTWVEMGPLRLRLLDRVRGRSAAIFRCTRLRGH